MERKRRVEAILNAWPEEAREAAQLVIDKYGEPHEATDSMLVWHNNGPWKRTIVYREVTKHDFPVPHIDAVEQYVNYRVPLEKYGDIARFDGSVVVHRTAGEMSARCHDEEANFLALNLAHDIVRGRRTVQEAKDYYAHEFLAYREKEPTPYMEGLRFTPESHAGDPDRPVLSDEQLEAAVAKGKAKARV